MVQWSIGSEKKKENRKINKKKEEDEGTMFLGEGKGIWLRTDHKGNTKKGIHYHNRGNIHMQIFHRRSYSLEQTIEL